MPSIIHTTRFAQFLKALGELRGAEPPLQFLDDVLPVVTLNDLDMVEQARYRGEAWGMGSISATGSAINFSKCFLTNDTPSLLTVVEGVMLSMFTASTACSLWLGSLSDSPPPAGNAAGRLVDVRSAVPITTVPLSKTRLNGVAEAATAVGALLWRGTVGANGNVIIPVNAVMNAPPFPGATFGWSFIAQGDNGAAHTLAMSVIWRERDILPADNESR